MTLPRPIAKITPRRDPQRRPPVVLSAGGLPPYTSLPMAHLHAKDRVRLREDYLDLPRGAVGVVIGFYRTEDMAVLVKLELGLRKVPIDLLEPLREDG